MLVPLRLRFDFSNNGAIEPAKLEKIEAICREWVAAGRPVSSKEVSLAQAKAIKGLRAVFGEVCVCWEGGGAGCVCGRADLRSVDEVNGLMCARGATGRRGGWAAVGCDDPRSRRLSS